MHSVCQGHNISVDEDMKVFQKLPHKMCFFSFSFLFFLSQLLLAPVYKEQNVKITELSQQWGQKDPKSV